jgi:hypothetical protein
MTRRAVRKPGAEKDGLTAGGGDALPSNSGRERRTRPPSVLTEQKEMKNNSQERLDSSDFIEDAETRLGFSD